MSIVPESWDDRRTGLVAFYCGAVAVLACGVIAAVAATNRSSARDGSAEATPAGVRSAGEDQESNPELVLAGTLAERVIASNPDATLCVVVAGLAGELEGCTCAGPNLRGGLLQNLWRIKQLALGLPDLLVIDGGGNVEKSGGLFTEADAPPSFLAALRERFVGTYQPDSKGLIVHGQHYLLEESLPVGARGESLVLLAVPKERGTNERPRPLQNQSLSLRRGLVGQALGLSEAEPRFDLGDGDYFAETLPVSGEDWLGDPALVALRRRILGEWLEVLPLLGSQLRDSSDCISCHDAESQGWTAHGTHSAAWAALRGVGNATRNAFCVPCHTQGITAEVLTAQPIRVAPENQNVGCVSCHGWQVVAEGLCSTAQERPTIDTCYRCHTPGRREALEGVASLRSLVGCCEAE